MRTGHPGAAADAGGAPPAPAAGPVEVECWTDPLCCWSWAMEPSWQQLRAAYADQLIWRYRFGGMIPDWSSYHDPLNAISRPAQMGPLWLHAAQVSGAPIDARIWVEDPPASSYLPSIAVKAAERQSRAAGEWYLQRLREAVMRRGRNIARQAVLLAIARELAAEAPGAFDPAAFAGDLAADAAADAFREDLKTAAYRGIGRFPTLIFRRPGAPQGLAVVGYRPSAALAESLRQVAPNLAPARR